MSYDNILKQVGLQQDDTTYFCYLYIKIEPTAIISFFNLAIALVLLGYAVKQYRKTKYINMMSYNLHIIYIAIFVQLAAYIVKVIFSEIVYWIPRDAEDTKDGFYSIISKYVYVIDIIGVFAIQAMLIMVCYNWMDKIVQIFQELSNLEDNTQSKKNNTDKFFTFEKYSKIFLKFYLRLRFLFFGLLIAFISVRIQFAQSILLKITLMLLLAEATFVPLILGLGVFAIKRNVKMTELVGQNQTNAMVRQFSILIFCTVLRFIIDLIFVTFTFIKMDDNKQCTMPLPGEQPILKQVSGIAQIVVQSLFTHFLPIYIVLKIFKISKKNVDLSESLLAAQHMYSTTQDNN